MLAALVIIISKIIKTLAQVPERRIDVSMA